MPRATPRSIRFDPEVADRLSAYVSARPGWSGSSSANLFVDEGLRMTEHPGVYFREGATGRRAVLVGGPDVWEIVRAIRSARDAEPDLGSAEIVELVSANTGVAERLTRAALDYWAAYPDEVDSCIDEAKAAEAAAYEAWSRQQRLLAG